MDSGQHADRQSPGILRTFLSLLVMVAFVFGLSWVLRTYVFQAYEIPSGSMEETIMVGDMVFSEKVSYYFRDPEPGDIVTFQDPEIPGRVLIKRCIAVGGQTVDINDEDGLVYVDGVALSEPYTRGLPSYHAGQRRLLSLHGARGLSVDDGGQPHEFAGFSILRRHTRLLGDGKGRFGVLAAQ